MLRNYSLALEVPLLYSLVDDAMSALILALATLLGKPWGKEEAALGFESAAFVKDKGIEWRSLSHICEYY